MIPICTNRPTLIVSHAVRLCCQSQSLHPPGLIAPPVPASPSPPVGVPATPPATVSVPLPSDVYGSAPSLYIPLPARHFSSMSKSELALVIKLQLSQLQNQSSDSHHNDTFYSSVMEMRTKGRVSKSLQQLPPIMHNRHHSTQTTAAGTGGDESSAGKLGGVVSGASLYFKPGDSTLGRLQSSSLKKPKKLMELSADQIPNDNADDGRSLLQHTLCTMQSASMWRELSC